MGDLANKVAVITGGGYGIGRAIAEKFDAEGAKVAIFGRDEKKLEQTCSKLKNGLSIHGDVTKIVDLDRLYKEVYEKFGKIDVVVANAGMTGAKHLRETDEQFFDQMVATNYKGVYFTVQRALPYLNEGASIILISSLAAHIGWANFGVYSSTKAAVSYLARSFSADLVDQKIRVNAISPGFVDATPFGGTFYTEFEEIAPVKRSATADEIADLALFLATPKSAYIVGEDLVIDGGVKAIFQR